MSKTEMVKNLSNSPRAREQSQDIQTTAELQNYIAELAELSSGHAQNLKTAIENAELQITEAKGQSQQVAKHQHQLQKNALMLNRRQREALDTQQDQINQMNNQVNRLIENQKRQTQQVPWLILGGVTVGALTASLVTSAIFFLLM